jgi:uncharacterized membrane protein
MAELIAVGYDDERNATVAADEIGRLARALRIDGDAVGVVVREPGGDYKITVNHRPGRAASWRMFWELLFSALFSLPLSGMAAGPDLRELTERMEKLGVDTEFQHEIRDLVQPGMSALFLIVEQAPLDKTLARLSPFGGTVLKAKLAKDAKRDAQRAVQGSLSPA